MNQRHVHLDFDRSFEKKKSLSELQISVQVQVIERLALSPDLEESAKRYVTEGYAARCRALMQTEPRVKMLLEREEIDAAADLLVRFLTVAA